MEHNFSRPTPIRCGPTIFCICPNVQIKETTCQRILAVPTTSGSFTTLYSFSSTPGKAWLVQAANETLYGIAVGGGFNRDGMAFTLTLPSSTGGAYTCSNTTPPIITTVESASAYGSYSYFGSGSWIEIKGTNLADLNLLSDHCSTACRKCRIMEWPWRGRD